MRTAPLSSNLGALPNVAAVERAAGGRLQKRQLPALELLIGEIDTTGHFPRNRLSGRHDVHNVYRYVALLRGRLRGKEAKVMSLERNHQGEGIELLADELLEDVSGGCWGGRGGGRGRGHGGHQGNRGGGQPMANAGVINVGNIVGQFLPG